MQSKLVAVGVLAIAVSGCGRLNFDPLGDAGATGTLDGGVLGHSETYVKASNTAAGDQFGCAIAISADGSTMAVGAYFESSDATGIDGDQADNSDDAAGAAQSLASLLATGTFNRPGGSDEAPPLFSTALALRGLLLLGERPRLFALCFRLPRGYQRGLCFRTGSCL